MSTPETDLDLRAAGGNLVQRDGEVYFISDFLVPREASRFSAVLQQELAWQQETIVIAGKRMLVPRLVCWYGDTGAVYRYSGVEHHPLPWTASLEDLKECLQRCVGCEFNSVLGNYYRSGDDSMGWHADKERELGTNPTIASLSFGAERRFLLRHNKTRETVQLNLMSGSLLVMGGRLQHHWRHCVPKSRAGSGARINLTFRKIITA